jgi:hypothetical protein
MLMLTAILPTGCITNRRLLCQRCSLEEMLTGHHLLAKMAIAHYKLMARHLVSSIVSSSDSSSNSSSVG